MHTPRHIRERQRLFNPDEPSVLLGLEALTETLNLRYATRSTYGRRGVCGFPRVCFGPWRKYPPPPRGGLFPRGAGGKPAKPAHPASNVTAPGDVSLPDASWYLLSLHHYLGFTRLWQHAAGGTHSSLLTSLSNQPCSVICTTHLARSTLSFITIFTVIDENN